MRVNHKIFGTGTVISQDANTVKVDFNGEVKTLVIRYAKLANEDGTDFYTEPKKIRKPKKAALPKVDYSKYSDAELMQMHNELLSEVVDAKSEAHKDGKTGTH